MLIRTGIIRVGCLLMAGLWLTACGIPEEQYQATLDELKKVKAEMKAKDAACKKDKEKLNGDLSECLDENSVMKTKLKSLGQDLSKLKTQAGAYIKDIGQKEQQIANLLKAQEAARKRAQMFKDLVAKFQKMIDSGKLKVEMRKGRMIVKMSDKILFDPGKTKLKEEGEMAIQEVSQILSSFKKRQFQIAGHTDNIPMRSRQFKSNWELSAARAVNVTKFMIESGMDPKSVSASGYSEYDPVGDNSTDEGRAMNRRIEITLMPDLAELPGFSSN